MIEVDTLMTSEEHIKRFLKSYSLPGVPIPEPQKCCWLNEKDEAARFFMYM